MGELPFERISRDILIRKEGKTSPKFGCKPEDRPIKEMIEYGIINLDKPAGPTSHQAADYAKKILGIKKAGHSGTLDPKVTGVLPIALGKGTKIVQFLLPAGKEYICLMHLHKPIEPKKITKTMNEFVGKIKQLPPIKSAIKRQWRFRKIYYIEILNISEDNQNILFKVGCQAGTYIRKLCHDIGNTLGCGAHMTKLRRTKAGNFNERTTLATLQDVADAFHYYKEGSEQSLRNIIHPIEFAASHLPKVWIFDATVPYVCHGMNVALPGISKVSTDIQVGEQVAIMTLKDELVAIGETKLTSKELITKPKGIGIRTTRVFMEQGTYPKA